MCFSLHGSLREEFDDLYASLYDNPGNHIALVRALSSKWMGLTRNQLLEITGMNDGGSFTRLLHELEQSDFIISTQSFNNKKKDALYRLTDNYSLFYLKFMEGKRNAGEGAFINLMQTQIWKSWSGYAFENICFSHVPSIKAALGVAGVYTDACSYVQRGNKSSKGIQVDMLLDRADGIINVCEMKFYDAPFTINKKYAEELRKKQQIVQEKAPPKKNVFLTLITCFGVKENIYSTEQLHNLLTIEIFFK